MPFKQKPIWESKEEEREWRKQIYGDNLFDEAKLVLHLNEQVITSTMRLIEAEDAEFEIINNHYLEG